MINSINMVLKKYTGPAGAAKWAMYGKAEVAGLRMSLEAYRGSLDLVLQLVSVSLTKAMKDDMTAARKKTHDIKQDTNQIPQIIVKLTRLRAIVAAGEIPSATRGKNYVLGHTLIVSHAMQRLSVRMPCGTRMRVHTCQL